MSRNSAAKRSGGRIVRVKRENAHDDDVNANEKSRIKPAPLFPDYNLIEGGEDYTPPDPLPLSKIEEEEVARFLSIRRRFRNGPFYARLSGIQQTNPFEGMGKYSQRYIERTRSIPILNSTQREELRSVLGTKVVQMNGVHKSKPPPIQRHLSPTVQIKLEEIKDDDDADENPDDEAPEQEVDDEFESDEEEMAGDYNAEQYFDNGGEEAGDDLDLDGGDGGDAFS